MAEKDINVPSQVMLAFDFDEADLVANRAGQLTGKQRHKLKPNALEYYANMISVWLRPMSELLRLGLDILALLVWILLTLVAVLSFWIGNEVSRGTSLFLLFIAIGAALLWLILRRRGSYRPVYMRNIKTTEGIIRLKLGTQYRPPELRLNRYQFILSDAQMKALASGQSYRLYFVDRIILSMEFSRISSTDESPQR